MEEAFESLYNVLTPYQAHTNLLVYTINTVASPEPENNRPVIQEKFQNLDASKFDYK